MATAAEMAAFEADQTRIKYPDAPAAVIATLAAYDLPRHDRGTVARLAGTDPSDGWVNLMMRDREGRMLWLAGHDGQATLTYLASEWADAPPGDPAPSAPKHRPA